MPPREPNIIATNNAPTSVSDQARQNPDYQPATRAAVTTGTPPVPGEPYHATGFGALGTDGTAPPRSANSYRNELARTDITPAQTLVSSPSTQNVVEPQEVPQVEQTSPLPVDQPTEVPVSPIDRVTALETQVGSLGTMLATISNQLQGLNSQQLPGTANPLAPQHHAGSAVQSIVPRTTGPVIPTPSMNTTNTANQDPLGLKGLALSPGEEELTTSEYIEKHFRTRDLSIDQIAYMARLSAPEVIEILKELGYQFQEGV